MQLKTKRIYDGYEDSDGFRILVDRIWPRGFSKEKAAIDLWAKAIAPSTELRQWFDHDHAKWDEFQTRYAAELDANAQAFQEVVAGIKGEVVTLVYSSKEMRYNNATALKQYMERHLR